MAQNLHWRWIFIAAAVISVIGMLMVRGTPESKAKTQSNAKFDYPGVIAFMIMMVALQFYATQCDSFGWTSMASMTFLALGIICGVLFIRIEMKAPNAFVDIKLFKNSIFTGATISNLLLNGTVGILIVAMSLVQLGGDMTAQEAGLLTVGYGITIVAFIRVGEKLLQRFGSRKPMIWGSLIVGFSIFLLMPTHMMLDTYIYFAVIGFSLFGLGLAFYATPSTDAALSSLPSDQAGSGSGIYKMASSLGASFGVAISAGVFTALSGADSAAQGLDAVLASGGRQDAS